MWLHVGLFHNSGLRKGEVISTLVIKARSLGKTAILGMKNNTLHENPSAVYTHPDETNERLHAYPMCVQNDINAH